MRRRYPFTNSLLPLLNILLRCYRPLVPQDRIFMNAVDTGWINDENPLERARGISERHNFQTPIDEVFLFTYYIWVAHK